MAVLLLIGSVWFEDNDSPDDYRLNDRGPRQSINSEYEALVVSRRILERYHQRYLVKLRSHGFVASERRVDLLEVLREAGEEIGLLVVALFIGAANGGVVTTRPRAGQPVTLYSSPLLELELGLLHELDLLRLFTRVRSRAPGLFNVEQCSLVRYGDAENPSYVDANVGASCSIKVYSIATTDVDRGMAAL